MRTDGDARAIATAATAQVRQMDPSVPVADVRAMNDVVASSVALPRTTLSVLGAFAVVALFLATLGIYGVVSYSVSRRVREIGVRIALGAQRRDVLLMVVRQALVPTMAGVVVGLFLAVGATRVLTSLLYGVSPTDPTILVGLSLLLALVALAASYIPGRRATRVDPVIALRPE
jgi:ABC-type antimicrobial peptide transport system permease subunit